VFKLAGDKVAAFPSEHAAFPLLELLAMRLVSRRAAVFFGLWVLAVFFAVVYLGEHWVTDVLAGWAFSLIIFSAVRWYATRKVSQTLVGRADR
jgi:membrane-associated phospholipid phosphatase